MEILYHEEKINRPISIHVKALYIKKMNFFSRKFFYIALLIMKISQSIKKMKIFPEFYFVGHVLYK